MEHFDRLQNLMAGFFQVPESEITPRTKQDDLGTWDSLQHLSLMLALEQEFGVSLEVEDLSELTSVPSILKYLASRCETE